MQVARIGKAVVEELCAILQEAEHTPITVLHERNGVWLRGDNGVTELRILLVGDYHLTISRVQVKYKRKGTMRRIYEVCREFCQANDISQICIQSVISKEMYCWCTSMGFTVNECTYFDAGSFICGDYYKDIK